MACFYALFSILLLILILVFPDLCMRSSAIGLALLPIPFSALFTIVHHSLKDRMKLLCHLLALFGVLFLCHES